MNVIAIYANHDANITVWVNNKYRIFELERLMRERYFTLNTASKYIRIYDILKLLIEKEFGSVKFNLCITKDVPENHITYLRKTWGIVNFVEGDHHWEHAAGGFYLSGFKEALVISYDGGGWDQGVATYFNIYYAKHGDIKKLKTVISCNPGGVYELLSIPLKEVTKADTHTWGNHALSFPGKKMGLAGYGKVREEWTEVFLKFYKSNPGHDPKWLRRLNIGLELGINSLSGQDAWDVAATSQHTFEIVVLSEIEEFLEDYKMPVVLSGGCALNVLLNESLRKSINYPVYIQPNPNDSGLSFGMIVRKFPPATKPDITYNGFPLLDKIKLKQYAKKYKGEKYSLQQIAGLLNDGEIIGVVMGDSEVGPRALGNRSILCDPTYSDMKDILNSKVKYREWYRPFAPVVRQELCNKYFWFDAESPYMSFCPEIKKGVNITAAAHVDGTARVQTVTREQHLFLYDLLGVFADKHDKEVLLNTSFNIKGKPILTTIEDAIYILNTTEMDYVIIENYLFKKI